MIDLNKKATVATIKSFIRKNRPSLLVKTTSTFDGMCDGVRPCENPGFYPAKDTDCPERTAGVQGVWLVGGGRDCITPFRKDGFEGYEVYNCCGSFSVAVKA